MSKNMTAASTWTAICRGIADGDVLNSANLADIPVQDLLNRTEWMKDATLSYAFPVRREPYEVTVSRWQLVATMASSWSQFSTVTAGDLVFPLTVPSKGTISSITMTLQGGTGHGALPATMPRISLWKSVPGVSLAQIGAYVSDASASVGAYQAVHDLVISPAEVIAAGTLYYLLLNGETGANAQIGLGALVGKIVVIP